MSRRLLLSVAALAVVGLDLLVVLLIDISFLAPWARVGLAGFSLRLVVAGILFTLATRVLLNPHPHSSRRLHSSHLVLFALLLPTLAQFHFAGGRLGGDGVMYYVYTRSLAKDFDLDFENEYTQYGLITRGDLSMPTDTGLRRSIFAVGPGLMGLPFFFVGEAVARVQGLVTGEANLTGYGPAHRNAVGLGGLLYGFGALLLMHAVLRRHFTERTALGTTLLAWGATFLPWYMVQQPAASHAPSAFAAAGVLWLWEHGRGRRGPWGYVLWGLALGLAMCVRWQNGVLLVLPGWELLGLLRRTSRWWTVPRSWAVPAVCLAAGVLVGAFPQMAAWKTIYGDWLLADPPHGADFLRLDHPYILETLFSSRHGLLSWTPVFWAGYLGFVPLSLRRPQLALPLALPLVLMTYVNMCSGDWWAGGSFSNRRFDSLLPILVLGFAASIDVLRRMLRRRPALALGCLAVPFIAWNLTLAQQVQRHQVPRDDTVAFPTLVRQGWQVWADAFGSPNTWPANWIFAARTGRPPGQYDLLAGRYLFYRQNNLNGVIDIGFTGDDAFLGEGWSRIEHEHGVGTRRVRTRARLLAPLDQPLDLELRVRTRAVTQGREVRVLINGRLAGRFATRDGWSDGRVVVPATLWRREQNEIVLEVDSGGEIRVDYVALRPTGPAP